MADDLGIVVHLTRSTEERTDDPEDHQQIDDEEEEIVARAHQATTLGDGDDRCQHEPSSDVPRRRCREGELPEVRALEVILLDDTCQHREGRDAHGYPYEEGKGGEVRQPCSIVAIDGIAQWEGEDEGDEDPRMTDDDATAKLLAYVSETKLHPHGEHEEDQPEVTQELDIRQARGGEERIEGLGGHTPEERGPEEYPCYDLTDDGWLVDLTEEPAHSSCSDEDDEDL